MTKDRRPIEIVIVRHGIAVDIGENGVMTDEDRMLSDEGRVRTAEAARGLKEIGCLPDVILSSPLRRAMETALIVGRELGIESATRPESALLPEAEMEETIDAITAAGGSSVMVVGHMPHLSCLASYLLAGHENIWIPLKKASACSLLCERRAMPGVASLQWLLPPRVLRAIGKRPA